MPDWILEVMNSTTTVRPLVARLVTEGFTPVQIARLQALREAYPVMENTLTRREIDQLRFLRWRRANGLVES